MLVVLVKVSAPVAVPIDNVLAPALMATVLVTDPPAGMVPLGEDTVSHDGWPVTVKSIGEEPVF